MKKSQPQLEISFKEAKLKNIGASRGAEPGVTGYCNLWFVLFAVRKR